MFMANHPDSGRGWWPRSGRRTSIGARHHEPVHLADSVAGSGDDAQQHDALALYRVEGSAVFGRAAAADAGQHDVGGCSIFHDLEAIGGVRDLVDEVLRL